jgi:hypothetical protein
VRCSILFSFGKSSEDVLMGVGQVPICRITVSELRKRIGYRCPPDHVGIPMKPIGIPN